MSKAEKVRDLKFYILNVKLRRRTSKRDLSAIDYTRVFKKMHEKRVHKASSPGKHCIFRFMFEEKENRKVIYLSGTFAQFTFIENKDWFNINKLDLDNEFKLPDGLFPNAVITDFVFIPETHRFCYRIVSGKSVSPYPIKQFLEHAIDEIANADEFVQIDVETDKASIEKILNAKQLKKLFIDINYSNSDISGPVKEFVEKDIKASNAKRLEITATHKPDVSIEVNESKILKGALQLAVSNGEAKATILNEHNKTEIVKTSDYPRVETVQGVLSSFNDLVYKKVKQMFKRPRKSKDANKSN